VPAAWLGKLVQESAAGTSSPLLVGGATGIFSKDAKLDVGLVVAWWLDLAHPSLYDGDHRW